MTKLNEKAVLVKISGSTWRGITSDKTATTGAADHFGTTEKWLHVSKRLVEKEVLAAPKKILGAARNYLRGATVGAHDGRRIPGGLPAWDDTGWYILPNALNDQVLRNLGAFESQFDEAVDDLRKTLPGAVDRARQENPQLFNDNDYAGNADDIIEEHYSFSRSLDMIPDGDDIRVSASAEFVAALKDEVEGRAAQRLSDVATHTREALLSTLKHFASSLASYDPDDKRGTAFRDSTVERLREVIPVVRALNVEGDGVIDQAVSDIISVLGTRTAEGLREDHEDRKHVADEANKLANNLSTLFN